MQTAGCAPCKTDRKVCNSLHADCAEKKSCRTRVLQNSAETIRPEGAEDELQSTVDCKAKRNRSWFPLLRVFGIQAHRIVQRITSDTQKKNWGSPGNCERIALQKKRCILRKRQQKINKQKPQKNNKPTKAASTATAERNKRTRAANEPQVAPRSEIVWTFFALHKKNVSKSTKKQLKCDSEAGPKEKYEIN